MIAPQISCANCGCHLFKVIFTDSSNNICLGHESEDILNKNKNKTKKRLFPQFQLIPILRFQVMHEYVCFIAHIDFVE